MSSAERSMSAPVLPFGRVAVLSMEHTRRVLVDQLAELRDYEVTLTDALATVRSEAANRETGIAEVDAELVRFARVEAGRKARAEGMPATMSGATLADDLISRAIN